MASRVLLVAAVVAGGPSARGCRTSDDVSDRDGFWSRDPYVRIAVPRHDIGAGETIEFDDLMDVDLPEFATEHALESLEQAVGRVPRVRLLAGEPIREERLAPIDAGVGLSGVVPPGMVPLRLQGRPADADTVTAGVYVDLLATDRDRGVTRTVLSGVEVIAVIPADPHCDVGPTVVLAATPDLAARVGDLVAHAAPTFVLRSDLDFVTPR